MTSSQNQSDRRAEIRRKQREEALSVIFDDPLDRFACSDNESLRSVSQELANKQNTIKEKIRAFSNQSQEELGSFNPPRAQSFIEQRESIVEELATHLKSSRAVIREARARNVVDRPTAKKLLSEMENVDAEILKERAALAKNRVKLEYAILAHPAHARIGEAYLSAAVVDRLPDPAGATTTTSVQTSRDEQDQQQFRSLLIQAYSPSELAEHESLLWCPASRMWHENVLIKAAHLVPYALGEVNVSYFFGLPHEDGYEAIWSYRNGLLLHYRIKEALDAGRVVIVPAEDSSSEEFKIVVLDDELLSKNICWKGPTFGELNNTNLQFMTDSRPAKRSLYFLCLITLFRRFRHYGVHGQERRDQQKIKMGGRVWGTPGKWISQGIVRALAYEIGDIVHVDKVFEGIVDESSAEMAVEKEKDRKLAVQVREAVEGRDEEEEF